MSIEPGLLILQGNRLEMLRDVVFDWIAAHPLGPLDEEIFLVQSNGAAEWLKMSLASSTGICAATRVELPGRFLWRTYRRMLGPERIAAQSVLDHDALTWRLMRLLPSLLDRPSFAPIARFLADRSAPRRLQLARRLADLYDQYQVYRADWLDAWQRGGATLASAALPPEQRWQAELWRALVDGLDAAERRAIRPAAHRAFVDALAEDASPAEPLPRRVVLFGASHVSTQGLEALAALSKRMQIVFAIPNPCRYHWADILDGREALRAGPHRHPSKHATDLAALPLDAMHLHAHPLLAAWGRQGRDFMRQLDAFDDATMRRGLALPRVDHFDDGPGAHLLGQVQAAIRDLVPLGEHPRTTIAAADRSIVFHVAHGPHREVEILHDRLLALLADGADGDAEPLRPRDIVVMVPDIERFAPSIRAVFGQHERGDPRFVPFDIADLKSRGSDPLVVALEWLLRLPDERVRLQDVRDLLDVPAVAARLGLSPASLPRLFAWLAGAGVRWGLDGRHRARLGLGAAGEQNSWRFGLDRMLLGYASGAAPPFAGPAGRIAPFDEVGGLESADVGTLVDLVERLERWWTVADRDAAPRVWAERCRALVDRFFMPTDERERVTLAALEGALTSWLDACAAARFDEPVPLSVVREAWLGGIDGLDANRRFMTGGVTFCTSMPLRAVPFEVVCLLGMNDGDFPRSDRRDDFDLMSWPGQARPGDRSRRDDDRYLILEAVLSARRVLYVSWCGRSVRDNAGQPPSVLVSQLRDYLAAGWRGPAGRDVLADRTTEHPLQPFGRRYFEAGGPVTYAREWRAAHVAPATAVPVRPDEAAVVDAATVAASDLAAFLRNPVRAFFRRRLGVTVADETEAVDDDEPFALDGLERHRLRERLLDDPESLVARGVDDGVRARAARIVDEGALPPFARGAQIVTEAAAVVRPMIDCWTAVRSAYPVALPRRALRFESARVAFDDWSDGLRSNGDDEVRLVLTPSQVMAGAEVRAASLLAHWIPMLAASATGRPWTTIVIGCDASLALEALTRDEAAARLADLLAAWSDGQRAPLPFTAKTALATFGGPQKPQQVYDGGFDGPRAQRAEFALARLFPDFAALTADGRFDAYAQRLFAPLSQWARSATVEALAGAVAVEDAPDP